jgi:hypothetical protein
LTTYCPTRRPSDPVPAHHRPQRELQPDEAEQVVEVARDADGDHRHDRGVLQQQVPADEPGGELAQDDVAVGVGRTRLGDEPGELGVGERRGGAGDAGDEEGQHDGRPRLLVRDGAGQGEDPRTDDAADADRGELPQAERALQPARRLRFDVLDGFAAQERGLLACLGHLSSGG